MQLETLKEKIKNKEITINQLEIEDLFKLSEGRFINNALKEEFNLNQKQINKFRKEKNFTNFNLENLIRNLIVLYDYIQDNYPEMLKYYIDTIPTIASSLGQLNGKKEFFERKTNDIDWNHLNPKLEIKTRKIDVGYRLEKLKKIIFALETNYLKYKENEMIMQDIKKENSSSNKIIYKPKKKTNTKTKQTLKQTSRDTLVKKRALEKANYKCELNPNHQTFINKSNGKPYVLGHHLIPLEFEYLFPYSLDIEANIVSLCSLCHDEIHHGINYKELIDKLYKQRKDDLKKCGIEIEDINMLYNMYDRIRINETLNK